MRRSPVLCLLSLSASAWFALPAAGQNAPVRYVPLESWVMPYVEHLVRNGVLQGLDEVARPFRRADVARAVAEADDGSVSAGTRSVLALLAREFTELPDPARWTIEAHAGALAASDASRDRLRPVPESSAVFPQAGLAGSIELPYVALVTSPAMDNRLRRDPWYTGKKDRFMAGRNATSYALVSTRFAELFFGSLARNWGPPAMEGLLLSPSPYPIEHFALRIGTQRLRLETVAMQLERLTDSSTGRYLMTHRLVAAPSSRLTFTLEESAVALGEDFPWRHLNPLTLSLLSQTDGGSSANSLVGASVVWRGGRATRVFGQLMLDDIQIDSRTAADSEPVGYGFTLGASGPMPVRDLSWSFAYTRVTNLAYRTPSPDEVYTSLGVGIARNFTDYDQVVGRISAIAPGNLLLTGELSLIRQGEGDLRQPYPAATTYHDSLTFLTGVVATTAQLGVAASWSPASWFSALAYLGYARTRNAGHVTGSRENRAIWRVQGTLRRRWMGALD